MSTEVQPTLLRKMISEKQLLTIVPASKASIRRWIMEGIFPRPATIGPARIAWFLDEIEVWQNNVSDVRSHRSAESFSALVQETRGRTLKG